MNILVFLVGLIGLFYAVARHRIPFGNIALIAGLFLAVFTLLGGFSLFWHALDIVWIAVFTIVYLLGANQ